MNRDVCNYDLATVFMWCREVMFFCKCVCACEARCECENVRIYFVSRCIRTMNQYECYF